MRIKALDLYPQTADARIHGNNATLCGWGTVKGNDQRNSSIENAEYSEDLHCLILNMCSIDFCRRNVRIGNFKTKLLCGMAKITKQTSTMVIP